MLTEFLKKDLFVDQEFANKKEALTYFANLLKQKNYVSDQKAILNAALKREEQFPTNIGSGVGMPHVLDKAVNSACILFAKVHGLVWDETSPINNKVDYVFFLNYNKTVDPTIHMKTIQELSQLLLQPSFVTKLATVQNFEELVELIEKTKTIPLTNNQPPTNSYDLVAVAACPTGIAHTFLAKEALEKIAKEMHLSIKVETQGTEGTRNAISQEELTQAKGIILALDRSIDKTKFLGRTNVIEVSTREVIHDPRKVIKRVLENQVNTQAKSFNDDNLISFNNFGRRIYQSLMNGVGHMLPFVIFGGIMIAIAFMIDSFAGVPRHSESKLGVYHDSAKWFNQLGFISFHLMIPMLAAYMAFGLVGKGGLLPGFVCGFIATGSMVYDDHPWFMGFLSDHYLKMLSAGSGFFGAIGGALITAVLFILITKHILEKLPKSLSGISNILFMPLFGTLAIVTVFFFFNIPLQFINLGFGLLLDLFNNKPALYPLLGIIMGLMMCSDLGGPINKAAYVFGTITLQNVSDHGSIPMAIAMGSGMVPPLAIALSGTFDKKLWTPQERKESYVNYVMGISFITEGAIPYTAAQPKKMLIANLVGGAVSGIMLAALMVGSIAPHGGIFVLPLLRCNLSFVNSEATRIGLGIVFFLLAVLAGAFSEMMAIHFLSKSKKFNQTLLK